MELGELDGQTSDHNASKVFQYFPMQWLYRPTHHYISRYNTKILKTRVPHIFFIKMCQVITILRGCVPTLNFVIDCQRANGYQDCSACTDKLVNIIKRVRQLAMAHFCVFCYKNRCFKTDSNIEVKFSTKTKTVLRIKMHFQSNA